MNTRSNILYRHVFSFLAVLLYFNAPSDVSFAPVVAPVATMFKSVAARADHFTRHQQHFRITTADEYEKMAREFLNAPLVPTVLECVRSGNGDVIRFDTLSDLFAIMRSDGIIKTFYKVEVAWHGKGTNLDYFHLECAK